MESLELKVPPPLAALFFALLMWLASLLIAPLEVPLAFGVTAALVLAGVGVSLAISGIASFRRAQTTINPFKPAEASSLVCGGIYRFTRNPMYLGLVIDLLAWAVFLSNVLALLVIPIFVLYINRSQVIPEERALTSLFGDEFAAYKAKVRRWL